MVNKLQISDLIPTQEGLRHEGIIPEMMEFVSHQGIFTKGVIDLHNDTDDIYRNLIQIVGTMGERKYVLDGHHRIVSIKKAGRDYLYPHEYELKHMDYTDLNDLAPDNGWYTPFDPRFEVRLPNTKEFKDAVKSMFLSKCSFWDVCCFVYVNQDKYKAPRSLFSFDEFIDLLGAQNKIA